MRQGVVLYLFYVALLYLATVARTTVQLRFWEYYNCIYI